MIEVFKVSYPNLTSKQTNPKKRHYFKLIDSHNDITIRKIALQFKKHKKVMDLQRTSTNTSKCENR